MRCPIAAVFVLALGCGANGGAGSALTQRAVFAASAELDKRSEPQSEVVRGLPVLAVVRGGPVTLVLRGDVSAARARAIVREAKRTVRDFARRFGADAVVNELRDVDVCVFESTRAYEETARAVFDRDPFFAVGFYMPSHRLVMVDTSRGLGNLRHELIHPLLKDWWPAVPAWVDEGIASLYGTASARSSGLRFVSNYRLRHLRSAARRDALPTLSDLAASSYDEVHGPDERAYYAVSRYLMLYLDRRGTLARFVLELRRGAVDATRQREVLGRYVHYQKFLRWTRRLRTSR